MQPFYIRGKRNRIQIQRLIAANSTEPLGWGVGGKAVKGKEKR